MRSYISVVCTLLTITTFGLLPKAQAQQQVEQSANYVSELDKSLTIRRVGVLPVTDNLEGIYARPIEARLIELIKESHRWDYAETNVVGQVLTPQDLEGSPEQVKKVTQGGGADAVFSVRATRGPNGVSIVMDLFLVSDGKLLLQETLKDHTQFETKDLLAQTKSMHDKLVQKLPYSGIVLSRTNNRVTVNLGKKDGIAPNTVITAILLIKATRHPKFNFLISSEREVLGKIKIEKVDDTIAFGVVISEKSRGAIERNSKLTGLDFVKYDDTQSYVGIQKDGLNPNDDANKISFGSGAQEWVPATPPTFGKVGLMLGLGSYNYNSTVEGLAPMSASASLFPSIRLDGELWLTPDWNVITLIRQGVASVPNPQSGSTPESLSVSISRYSFYVAHNFLITGDFFGPKIQVFTGWSKYSAFVDASSPLSLTSTSYSGLVLGLKGEVPVDDAERYTFGASLELYLTKDLAESPSSSGAENSNSVNTFSVYGFYKMSPKLRGVGAVDFESYATTFSGDGTRGQRGQNSSQRIILFSGGLEYLF